MVMCIAPYFYGIAFAILTASIAYAKNIHVNNADFNCNDIIGAPFCTISGAISYSKANDTIFIKGKIYEEYLVIDKSLKLIAEGEVTINALQQMNVVTIRPGVKAKLENLQLLNGYGEQAGGVLNYGSLLIKNCIISNNISLASGGGITNARSVSGSLLIENSIIQRNIAKGDDPYHVKYGGGGIYNNAPLQIINSKIIGNQTMGNGGGVYTIFAGRTNPSAGEVVAEQLGIVASENRAKTLNRRHQNGAVLISNSEILDNESEAGGGIYVHGILEVASSIIDGNKATKGKRSSGGGIFAHLDTSLELRNTLISHNTATFRGGGIRFYSTRAANLFSISILDNEVIKHFGNGGGIFVVNGANLLLLNNSVIANNKQSGLAGSDCSGKIDSRGYNFLSSRQNCIWDKHSGDLLASADNLLDPLMVWNNEKRQYQIDARSKVIDKGDPAGCVSIDGKKGSQDVYGNPRQIDAFGTGANRCDIGAIEYFAGY